MGCYIFFTLREGMKTTTPFFHLIPSPIPPEKMVVLLVVQSVTNMEIERYRKRRQMLEEDHLDAAIKAAARVRTQNLSDDGYLQFDKPFKEEEHDDDESKENRDIRIGIKNWWRESKYAYLNQPAMKFETTKTIFA